MSVAGNWLDTIERLHNKASDTAFVWFPFNWMRPAASESMSMARRLRMTLAFGIYYGLSYAVTGALFRDRPLLAFGPGSVLSAMAIFFVWFNLVTAPLWNRRARRYRRDGR